MIEYLNTINNRVMILNLEIIINWFENI